MTTKSEELEKRLDSIEKKLDDTIALLDAILHVPYAPPPIFPQKLWPGNFSSNKCSKCDLELNQVLGYVCPDIDCPTGLGGTRC